jgi:hypothetical protein
MKSYFFASLFVLLLAVAACSSSENSATPQSESAAMAPAQSTKSTTPTISLSRTRLPEKGWVKMFGKGFTPKQDVISHLMRPDGREFPELRMLTDEHGEFTHEIDSLLLKIGTHDLWVLDTTTGITSNTVHFEVTHDQGPAERPIQGP